MAKSQLDTEAFYESLVQFLLIAKHQLVRAANAQSLTYAQALMLLTMHGGEPRPMNSFCGMLGCNPSNITGIIDGLQKKGLIRRTEHPHDRRVKVVHLEPAGLAARAALLTHMRQAPDNGIAAQLDAGELVELARLIQKVTAGACANNTTNTGRPSDT